MRILFLCGSLEKGRDGVGDYTRRLSGEILKQGHEVSIVAFNDQFVSKEIDGYQDTDDTTIRVLRIPALLSANERFRIVKNRIDLTNPDIVSLQFVLFSLHPKGLPIGTTKFFISLREGRKLHIMYHELWVGMESQAGLKSFIWGTIQRYIIRTFTKKLKPGMVHTQTKLYQKHLRQLGVAANYLPLFSNIPIAGARWRKASPAEPQHSTEKKLVFVVFGSIHRGTPVHEFCNEVAKYSSTRNLEIILQFIGRNGTEQQHWASVWESVGLCVESLGEQTSENISYALQNASVGISTTPYALTEKSGSVAAMLEHGLPVICVAKTWNSRRFGDTETLRRLVEYRPGRLEEFLTLSKEKVSPECASLIAEQFVNDLNNFS